MIVGVGIDAMSAIRISSFLDEFGITYENGTFTERERDYARSQKDPARAYAGMFAVKEAVFKAMSPLIPERPFDPRIVETLHRDDGSPFVVTEGLITEAMRAADVDSVLVSITDQGDMALAFALCQRSDQGTRGISFIKRRD